MRGDVVAADSHLPARRPDLAEHHADGGALARAVVAQQAVDFAGRHLEGQVVHRQLLAELLAEMLELNHWPGLMVPAMTRRFLMWPSA